MRKVECLGWNTMLYLRSASSLAYSLNFSLPWHLSPPFLTFKQSVCFQGSCYALALWSVLTKRTTFQRVLATPGDLYKICKDHNKHLQKISIYRDHPGHTFHYVNCPSNHLTQACFLSLFAWFALFPLAGFPVRFRHFLTEPARPRHLRELSQQGAISHHTPLISQKKEGRSEKDRVDGKEQGMGRMIVWSGDENVRKKVWRSKKKVRAHQKNK